MKILLVGNGDRQNRGCEAITITTVSALRDAIPDAQISILSFSSDEDKFFEDALRVSVSGVMNSGYLPGWRILHNMNCLPRSMKARYDRLLPYVKELRTADLVLSLGGDNYTDDYGTPYLYWKFALWAQKYRKPFVLWGASVGPFKSDESLGLARKGLKAVSLVTAREDATIEYLRQLNYDGKMERVYDSAFLLKPREVGLPRFARNAEVVGFNLSPLYWKFSSMSKDEVLAVAKAFLYEISHIYNILLIPHVVYRDHWNNDARYMDSLADGSGDILMANPEYDCRQLKYLISQCGYLIAARTHATIAAFSQGIPTLSLGYSRKASGLNHDLFGSEEFLLDASEYSVARLREKFEFLVKHKQRCTSILREKAKVAEGMVRIGIDRALELCR